MPVISSVTAITAASLGAVTPGTAAIGGLVTKAMTPSGKKQAAAAQANQAVQIDAGKWGGRFSGIMAGTDRSVSQSAIDRANESTTNKGPLGMLDRENLGTLSEKYPDNPAYELALKADEIFKPEITQVLS